MINKTKATLEKSKRRKTIGPEMVASCNEHCNWLFLRGDCMKKKRRFQLRHLLVPIIVLTLIVSNESFAYWASNVIAPNAVESTSIIDIGEWEQAFPYDGNNDYEPGDIVTFNGNTYQATSSFWSNIVPPSGSWLSFLGWTLV